MWKIIPGRVDKVRKDSEAERNTEYLETKKKGSVVTTQSHGRVVQGEDGEVSRVQFYRDL